MDVAEAPLPDAASDPLDDAGAAEPAAEERDVALREPEPTPEPELVADAEPVTAAPGPPPTRPEPLGAFLAHYGQYVALFVGAGLISGAVVHFPLPPVRYAAIGLLGGGLFAAASVVTDRATRTPKDLARIAVSALALALGLGMVSGSIQHFTDIPQRAAVLIPLGLALSFGAYLVRHDQRPRKQDATAAVAWALVVTFVLLEGLGKLADTMGPAAAHHHAPAAKPAAGHTGGGHAAEEPEAEKPAAETEHAADDHGH